LSEAVPLTPFLEVGAGLPLPPALGIFGEGRHIAVVGDKAALFQKFVTLDPGGGHSGFPGGPSRLPIVVCAIGVVIDYPFSRREDAPIQGRENPKWDKPAKSRFS
jgi:hypothetical protein